MKKIILVSFLFTFLFTSCSTYKVKTSEGIYSVNKYLRYDEYLNIDSLLYGNINHFLLLSIKSNYYIHFQYTVKFEDVLNTIKSIQINPDILKILKKNKDSFYLRIDEMGNLFVFYQENLLMIINNDFDCDLVSESSDLRTTVNMFDKKRKYIYNEKKESSFRKELSIIRNKYHNLGYKTIQLESGFEKQTLCQYDDIYGFFQLCPFELEIIENNYIKEIELLSTQYCKRYKLSKIIFAASILEKQ
jgi:hypothetical protein